MTTPETTPTFSIIVCLSSPQIARDYLLRDLGATNDPQLELIILDNVGNKSYSSISKAYNAGASRARGKYLVFAHQDIRLHNVDWARNLSKLLAQMEFAIAGPSGVRGNRLFYSDSVVLETNPELGFSEPLNAGILDESLFIVPKAQWLKHPFSESLITGFHLCAAEYCLRVGRQGGRVVLIPIPYAHYNLAALTPAGVESIVSKRRHVLEWVSSAKRLAAAYPGDEIVTPQGRVGTRLFVTYFLFYGVLLRITPRLGLRVIGTCLKSGLYVPLNRWAKGLSYA